VVLGHVALKQGEYPAARALCEESLDLSREVGDKRAVGHALGGLGAAAVDVGQGARGAALLGAAAGILETMGTVVDPAARGAYEAAMESARALLGDEAYERAWQAGRALSLEQGVALALEQETPAG
jgi:non-specific serine/threonine protein kinase